MSSKIQPKKKSDVQFNGERKLPSWSTPYVLKSEKEFHQRFEKIKKEFDELLDEVYWTNLVYSSEIRFEPVINNVYHLYKKTNKDEYFLSLIAPNEWKMDYVSSFRFEHTGKWTKVNLINV